MSNFNFTSQSHLIIGSQQNLLTYTIDLLQSIFCKTNNCKKCVACLQIKQKNYSQILWLIPEKQYNLELIDSMIKNISFSRLNEKFFIIFESAELLTIACSNRLLKIIEEPSQGYYFLFLTHRPKSILPTINSRCIITKLNQIDNSQISNDEKSELKKFFIDLNLDPINFLKHIDKISINENETIDLIDSILQYWFEKCKKSLLKKNTQEYLYSLKIIDILNESLIRPPMPGGNKIFWKNLFLKFKNEKSIDSQPTGKLIF